jgi:hypothetical protein
MNLASEFMRNIYTGIQISFVNNFTKLTVNDLFSIFMSITRLTG